MSEPNSQERRRDPPFSATLRAPFLFRDRCPIPAGMQRQSADLLLAEEKGGRVNHRGGRGPGVCAPGVCAPGGRCERAPWSQPGARHCHCRRSVWTRRRRRWSPGGRGLAAKADSSNAPSQTGRLQAPPPPLSPTTSLSTGATGLVRVRNHRYSQREAAGEKQHQQTGSQAQLA